MDHAKSREVKGERESVKRNMDDTDKEIKLKRKDAQIMKGWKRKGKKKGSEKKKKRIM